MLGAFYVELVQFDEVGVSAMTVEPLAVLGVLTEGGEVGDELSLPITEAAAVSFTPGDLLQLRFRFETATDGDGSPDALILSIDSLELGVSVLVE